MSVRQEECEEKKDSDEISHTKKFLEQFQTQLIGDYFCYRSYHDEVIRIRKLTNNDKIGFKQRIINIRPVLADKKEDCKFIQFRAVPVSSYLTIKGECAGNMTFYETLIGVTIRNTTFIFDLDDEYDEPKEVNFIEGTDQLLTLDGFVNLGTIHLMVILQKKAS